MIYCKPFHNPCLLGRITTHPHFQVSVFFKKAHKGTQKYLRDDWGRKEKMFFIFG